jgi:hypothetical protein
MIPKTVLKFSLSCLESPIVNTMLISSANKVGFDMSFITAGRSFIYNKKNNDPRIDPCGTPNLICFQSEKY